MKCLTIIKFAIIFVICGFIYEIQKCNAIKKSSNSYPVLKIKIVEKNKKPVKIDAKVIRIPVPEEKQIKKNLLRRRFHNVKQKYPPTSIIREKSFGPIQQSSTNSMMSAVNPISSPFHIPSSTVFTQIPQNYFLSAGYPDEIDYTKGLQSHHLNNGNVLTKMPNPTSKDYFKKGHIDVYDTNSNYEFPISNNVMQNKHKKYFKKYNLNALNTDFHGYGIEKPKYVKEPQKLQQILQHPPHNVDEDSSSSSSSSEEAEKILKFMKSQEYFLPKIEPNYKFLTTESASKGVFLEEPRPTISYLPLVLNQDQTILQKFALPSYSTKSSLHYQRQLQKPDPKVFYDEHIQNDSAIHYYPSHHHYHHHNQAYNNHNRRHLEPERIEFTEKDAVIPNPTAIIDDIQNDNNKFDLKMSETNPEPSSMTPFRLIVDDSTTTEFSPNSNGDNNYKINSDKMNKMFVKNFVNHKTENILSDIEEYCNQQCKNDKNQSKNEIIEENQIICGTDGISYNNEEYLYCMSKCQRTDVKMDYRGPCKNESSQH